MSSVAVGTDIYIHYIETGTAAKKFVKYDTLTNGYTALTASGTAIGYLFYYDGFIYGTIHATNDLARYNITTGIWTDAFSSDIGFTPRLDTTIYPVFHQNRLFGMGAGATNSIWYTIHYPLVTMTARALCGFRKSNDTTYYGLKNATSDLNSNVNGSVACNVGDILALNINNKSATDTAVIDVYG